MSKLIMFFGFMWLITCIAGGVMVGYVPVASTHLTADISDSATTITVESTTGFPEPGIIVINEERIAYSSTTATTFAGNLARPLQRGASDTGAVAHSDGTTVRMVESTIINNSVDYDLAILADAAGVTLSDIQKIETYVGGGGVIMPAPRLYAEAAMDVPVATGEMQISLDVSVIFTLQ